MEKKKFTFNNTMGILLVIIVFSLLIWTRSKEFISVDNFITVMKLLLRYSLSGCNYGVSSVQLGYLAAVIVGAMIQRVGLPWFLPIVIALLIEHAAAHLTVSVQPRVYKLVLACARP